MKRINKVKNRKGISLVIPAFTLLCWANSKNKSEAINASQHKMAKRTASLMSAFVDIKIT
ncbi:hypothetical protein GCM10027429_02090 [Marivirga atlantica]|jgi:cytosine/uracil/thiamine/allantoin permease